MVDLTRIPYQDPCRTRRTPNLEGAQEPPGGEMSMTTDNSTANGIYELEQLLKKKIFSRSEIAHLTELLHSRALEMSARDDAQRNKLTVPDLSQHQQILSGFAEENKSHGTRSSADMLTRPLNSSSKINYRFLGMILRLLLSWEKLIWAADLQKSHHQYLEYGSKVA